MSHSTKRTFTADFRLFFLRGLVVLLPSVLTLWIVVKAYQFVDNTIAQPINGGLRLAMERVTPHWSVLRNEFEPTEEQVRREMETRILAGRQPKQVVVHAELRRLNIRQWWESHWWMGLIGLIVAIIAVYISGRLVGGFLGRRIYRKLEGVITTLPVFRQVYPYVKQVVDFLFSDDDPIKFNRVVVVEYPRKGIWSLGFMTGDTMRSIAEHSGDAVTIFIPSSPTPFTGYTLTVPRNEVIEVPITVEEAMRFAVTGGVLIPDHQVRALQDLIPIIPAGAGPERPEGDDGGEDDAADDGRRRDAG